MDIDTGTNELLCTVKDGVATVTLNRPEARNAMSPDLTAALRTQLAEVEKEYIVVMGTEDQKFVRSELDKVKKEVLELEEEILWDLIPEAFAAVRAALA